MTSLNPKAAGSSSRSAVLSSVRCVDAFAIDGVAGEAEGLHEGFSVGWVRAFEGQADVLALFRERGFIRFFPVAGDDLVPLGLLQDRQRGFCFRHLEEEILEGTLVGTIEGEEFSLWAVDLIGRRGGIAPGVQPSEIVVVNFTFNLTEVAEDFVANSPSGFGGEGLEDG